MTMREAEWQCLCNEWVPIRYRQHTHASLPVVRDRLGNKLPRLGEPPEVWTYDRKPTDAVRAHGETANEDRK